MAQHQFNEAGNGGTISDVAGVVAEWTWDGRMLRVTGYPWQQTPKGIEIGTISGTPDRETLARHAWDAAEKLLKRKL